MTPEKELRARESGEIPEKRARLTGAVSSNLALGSCSLLVPYLLSSCPSYIPRAYVAFDSCWLYVKPSIVRRLLPIVCKMDDPALASLSLTHVRYVRTLQDVH